MKKKLLGLCSLILILALGIYGCGQSSSGGSSVTTTTTSTTNAQETARVNTAKAGAIIASGASMMGSTASQINGSGVSGSSVLSVKNIRILSGPPSGFFDTDLTASSNGYISVSDEAISGNMHPYLRMRTRGGDILAGTTLFASKKIASFGAVTVQRMMQQDVTDEEFMAAIQTFVTTFAAAVAQSQNPYNNTSLFRSMTTAGDYVAWSYMFPTMEAGMSQLLQGATLTTPEVSSDDLIGSMECVMVFTKNVTGEIAVPLSVQPNGDPRPDFGTYSGSGTLAVPGTSLEATITMAMTADESGEPSPSSITISGTTTPEGDIINIYLDTTTGTGTGEVKNSSGTTVGTITFTATGGYYTPTGSTSIEFEF